MLTRDRVATEACIYCQLVTAGKPVASMQVPVDARDVVEAICRGYDCLTFCDCSAGPDQWCVIYIYRESVMLDVIQHSLQFTDSSPLEIWFRGCMYGYPLSAIQAMANGDIPCGA